MNQGVIFHHHDLMSPYCVNYGLNVGTSAAAGHARKAKIADECDDMLDAVPTFKDYDTRVTGIQNCLR